MDKNKKMELLGSVPIPKALMALGVPTIIGMLINALYNLVDKDTANRVASTALYSGIAIGTIVILFSVIFLEPILRLTGAIDDVMPYALTYARIYIIFSIFNVFNVTMNNIASSEGAAKTAMSALLAGAALNVVLDPILIYGFDMGVAGAAIATAISQIVSTLVYLNYIFQKKVCLVLVSKSVASPKRL